MNDAWRDYSSAPPAGAPVCASGLVGEGVARCLTVESAAGAFPLLLLRRGGVLRAYVNACPHQYLPLDYRSGNVLSADGTRLLCSAHGAVFDAATGGCLSGDTADGLDPVPVVESEGLIRIAG
ncbi:Rieske 2Fe-2S domain-containing protein [Bosea sp. (in: a-proteobacteria)]|uniref:Rieske (2Fe-2S) protein n=1 Tax=Bosea sp. (in: a-proteobacteria) TaxID=1871050 RepID=UPI001AC923F4|nr:Rieske 2Fe-2S domain-containing protein [Bosea sp. (in: a-proteobacteria)]MBN9441691.1 Rieske 2Fe-2S domain-containing protein [Bosea sp. (in: a-proteobacteria)]